ncbi:GNAT family N-acetyltransferase [Dictyobacter formicarum]|uniref:N-acetyltransferase n=1 Tax=Dictyobacter formicarum TaxID=2778368 RepID=A0ABQ3VKT9_9CHLR|nr:GNAT family N-acetyltransferase [Dictyobacter formicarum]GHO86286.1 N-acetyltransferase [Dictyobacter formicarum]
MRKETLPLVTDYVIRYLTLADTASVQDLYERCADYIELATGGKPGPDAAQHIFTELPAGKTYNDKLLIGIFTPAGRLIGLVDAIRDYPTEHEWYLYLLLLDPQERNRGLGEKIYHIFAEWAAMQGAQAISLAVLTQNTQAQRFWQRLGFEAAEYTDELNTKDATRITLRRGL